jgi:hypothetical protein
MRMRRQLARGGRVHNLPDLNPHQLFVMPTLHLPIMHHPNVIFSPQCKALIASLIRTEGRLDNVLVETAGTAYYAQLLLLFRIKFDGGQHDCAFVWWYNEHGVDATNCACLTRAHTRIRVRGVVSRVPWTQVVSTAQVLHRVHLVPQRNADSWELSDHSFRDNRFMLSVPNSGV